MSLPKLTPEQLYGLSERFLDRREPWTATALRDWLREQGIRKATREQIFPLMRESFRRGLARLVPESNFKLEERLRGRYRDLPDCVSVVDIEEEQVSDGLARETAERLFQRIESVAERKRRIGADDLSVHIGFGAGGTARRVAERLAMRLEQEKRLPPLTFHALSSGFDPLQPTTAPVSFFSFFNRVHTRLDYVGLFTEPWVEWSDYEKIKKQLGVKVSFIEARKIDIVITSLAQAGDPHGLLNAFLRMYRGSSDKLRRAGHVGDIQWQPFSKHGPLKVNTGKMAVTLFDLPALVRMAASKDKHVVLVAGPCHTCGERKVPALRPLLARPLLRAFDTLITDSRTILEILDEGKHGSTN